MVNELQGMLNLLVIKEGQIGTMNYNFAPSRWPNFPIFADNSDWQRCEKVGTPVQSQGVWEPGLPISSTSWQCLMKLGLHTPLNNPPPGYEAPGTLACIPPSQLMPLLLA